MIYSGLQKHKKSSGLNHRQINAPVFLLRKVNFYLKTQYNRKCYNIDWFWLAKKKIIRVKPQANECASVSAAQGKLLHKETTEMLQNWSIMVCKKTKISGLNHRQMNAPVFLRREENLYPRTQQKMLQLNWSTLVYKWETSSRLNHGQINSPVRLLLKVNYHPRIMA